MDSIKKAGEGAEKLRDLQQENDALREALLDRNKAESTAQMTRIRALEDELEGVRRELDGERDKYRKQVR